MDKKQVMKQAQHYRAEGLSLRDAMTRAWCEAKIADIDNERFWKVEIKNYQTAADRQLLSQYHRQEKALRARIVLTPAEKESIRLQREIARREEERRIDNAMRQDKAWAEYQHEKFASMFPALFTTV